MTATTPDLQFDAAAHVYTFEGRIIPSVTQVLEAAGISDFFGVPPEILKHAQDRGTAVHQAAWFDDQNDLDESSVTEEIAGYVRAWRRFRDEQRVSIELIEQRFFSPPGFAGTFDRMVDMPKLGRVMLDLKTGEQTPSWRIQLAAYVRGFFGHMAPAVRRGAVKLRKDGSYTLHWYEMRDLARDWNVFAGALAVYQYRKEHGIL